MCPPWTVQTLAASEGLEPSAPSLGLNIFGFKNRSFNPEKSHIVADTPRQLRNKAAGCRAEAISGAVAGLFDEL